MGGPLAGVRVVELGVWVAGPAAAGILADWGAEVVKIEPPRDGDPARSFARMLGGDLPFNPPFEMDNRGKRSIALDLGQEEGRALARELVSRADVFVTNVRRPALARAGLDAATLLARHPRLVFAAISGYGWEGEDADAPAYDIAAYWARGGMAAALSRPGEVPPFQRGGMGDHSAGLSLAAAVSAALYAREKSGCGQLVSTSLLRQGVYTLSFDLAIALRFGTSLGAADRARMGNPAINAYRDRDGRWFWIVGLEAERHWPPLARVAGHPEWLSDPRFATVGDRARQAAEIIAELDAVFARRPLAEWARVFAAEPDLWWAPVQGFDELLADPQMRAAGGLVEVPDGADTTLLPATPCDFAGTPWAPRSMAPGHGEHGDAILRELGRSDADIDELRRRGVVV